MYMYVYTLAIAGQIAGPNWLTFFEGTHLIKIFYSIFKKSHGQRGKLQLLVINL